MYQLQQKNTLNFFPGVSSSVSINDMQYFTDKKTEEEYEVIDLSNIRDNTWIKKVFGDVTKASAAKQIGVGSVTGW